MTVDTLWEVVTATFNSQIRKVVLPSTASTMIHNQYSFGKALKSTILSVLVTKPKGGLLLYVCMFSTADLDQNTNEIFLRISALASKKRLNQKKIKALYIF